MRHFLLLTALFVVFSNSAHAEEGKIQKALDSAKATMNELPAQRAALPYTASLNAAIFETWVITKFGATLSYNDSPQNAYELEYLKGSLGFGFFGFNLGSVDEQKFSVLWRSYSERNTFGYFMGVNYSKFDVHLGSEFLQTVTGSERANVDVVEIATLGATWGFGQRWHTQNGIVWGVDWLTLSMPLVVMHERMPFTQASQSAEKREEVSEATKLFKRIPSVGVLKLQVGYSF